MRVNRDWELTPQRAVIHLPTATVVLADVHLGYQQARRRRGDAVPLISVEEHFAPLAPLLAGHAVRRLAVAGDLFEETATPELMREFLDWLSDVRLELLGLVPGNHDRDLESCGHAVPLFPEGLALGRWLIVHGDQPLPATHVLQGHVHPCFRLGGKINAPCFLVSPRRLVLPAFSPDAAGVSVLGEPSWAEFRCVVSTGEKLLDFGNVRQWQKTAQ